MLKPTSSSDFDVQVVQICHDFEAEWLADDGTSLKRFLKRVSRNHRGELFKILLEIDVEKKRKSGIVVKPDDYETFGKGAVRFAQKYLSGDTESNSGESTLGLGRSQAAISKATITNYFKSDKIGPYKLIEQIGEGGMGQVWKAEQRLPVRRKVALKLIKPTIGSEATIARFEVERQALALMEHANIAKIFDAGTAEDGSPFFVMELVEGTPLHHYLASLNLNITEKLELFIKICNAVQHAHQKGVIHRDLKPSNILVQMQDGRPIPKIIDFGLAKALKQRKQLTEKSVLTEFGNLVGTIQYMSPEQASLNGGEPDARSDIYSLGVILYELLVGEPPINRDALERLKLLEVLERIRTHVPERPSRRVASNRQSTKSNSQDASFGTLKLVNMLKGDLDWIVMKALEIQPERRYQSANSLAEDVRNYIACEPVNARPPSITYKLKKFAQKNKWIVATASLLAGTLIVASVAIAIFAFQANRSANDAFHAQQKSKAAELDASEKARIANDQKTELQIANEKIKQTLAFSNYGLANARWDLGRPGEARHQLYLVPEEYRNFEWYLSRQQFEGSDKTLYGHTAKVLCVAYDPQGNRIASGGADNAIRIWNAQTGELQQTLSAHSKQVTSVAFNGDGTQLVSGSLDMTIKIWDVENGKVVRTLKGHRHCVEDAAFIPDSNLLASASYEKEVTFWDIDTGKYMKVFGHEHHVSGVAVSPKGDRMVSGCEGGKVILWDLRIKFSPNVSKTARGNDRAKILNASVGSIQDVAYNPNGSTVAICGDRGCQVLDSRTGVEILRLNAHDYRILGVDFSPDGQYLATSSLDSMAKIWDANTGVLVRTLVGHTGSVCSVAFSPDSLHVATSSEDQTVKLWSLEGNAEQISIEHEESMFNDFAICPDSKSIATAGKDGVVRLVNRTTGEITKTSLIHSQEVNCLAFSPDGKFLASGGEDDKLIVYDMIRNETHYSISGEVEKVGAVCFSNDGTLLACGNSVGTVFIWNTTTWEQLSRFNAGKKIRKLEFSPDGKWITAASSLSKAVTLWDVKTGKVVRTFPELRRVAMDITFSPDGATVATCNGSFLYGDPSWITMWDVSSGKLIRESSHIKSKSAALHSTATEAAWYLAAKVIISIQTKIPN